MAKELAFKIWFWNLVCCLSIASDKYNQTSGYPTHHKASNIAFIKKILFQNGISKFVRIEGH